MSYRDDILMRVTNDSPMRGQIAEIAARADARITELETAITVRDTEIARLETDLELARVDRARMRRIDDCWVRKLVAGAVNEHQAAEATGLSCIEVRDMADKLCAQRGGL